MDALVDAMKLLVDLRHTHTGRGRKVTRARARDTHGARAQARAREEQKSRWVQTKLTCTRRRLTKDERVKRRAEAQRDPAMMDGQLERGEVQRKKSEKKGLGAFKGKIHSSIRPVHLGDGARAAGTRPHCRPGGRRHRHVGMRYAWVGGLKRCAAPAASSAAFPPRGSLGAHARLIAVCPLLGHADVSARWISGDCETRSSLSNGLATDGAPCKRCSARAQCAICTRMAREAPWHSPFLLQSRRAPPASLSPS